MLVDFILDQFVDITQLVPTFNCNLLLVTIIILGSSCSTDSFPRPHTAPIGLLATVRLVTGEVGDQEPVCHL